MDVFFETRCISFLPRYMECRRGLAMRKLFVRPSVRQARGLWQNGRKICPDFYTIRKINGWWGRPIFARSASAVTPSEKNSVNTNRKSTTRFSMSLRWSPYVAPKSPKGAHIRKRTDFCLKSHCTLRKSAAKFLCVKTVSGKVVMHAK